jgi:hypothetical protein
MNSDNFVRIPTNGISAPSSISVRMMQQKMRSDDQLYQANPFPGLGSELHSGQKQNPYLKDKTYYSDIVQVDSTNRKQREPSSPNLDSIEKTSNPSTLKVGLSNSDNPMTKTATMIGRSSQQLRQSLEDDRHRKLESISKSILSPSVHQQNT